MNYMDTASRLYRYSFSDQLLNGQNTRLRYVFDISDTHMVAGGRFSYLWQMQEHQREEILFHLTEVYGLEEKEMENLQDALMAVAREMVDSECR